MADPGHAMVFIDNHDNQRGHGGGGNLLTHEDPWNYKVIIIIITIIIIGIIRLGWASCWHTTTASRESWAASTSTGTQTGEMMTWVMTWWWWWDVDGRGPPSSSPHNDCGGEWACEHRWDETWLGWSWLDVNVSDGRVLVTWSSSPMRCTGQTWATGWRAVTCWHSPGKSSVQGG